jgi:hypothetical protein
MNAFNFALYYFWMDILGLYELYLYSKRLNHWLKEQRIPSLFAICNKVNQFLTFKFSQNYLLNYFRFVLLAFTRERKFLKLKRYNEGIQSVPCINFANFWRIHIFLYLLEYYVWSIKSNLVREPFIHFVDNFINFDRPI